jgi:uncharacterized protein YlzI (FlbEa/FlbD family)
MDDATTSSGSSAPLPLWAHPGDIVQDAHNDTTFSVQIPTTVNNFVPYDFTAGVDVVEAGRKVHLALNGKKAVNAVVEESIEEVPVKVSTCKRFLLGAGKRIVSVGMWFVIARCAVIAIC